MGQMAATVHGRGTPQQLMTSATYDADGRTLTSTDALGNVTSNFYDAAGRLVQTRFADGTSTETLYDAAGRAYLTTDRHVIGRPCEAAKTLYDLAGRTTGSHRLASVTVTVIADTATGLATATAADEGEWVLVTHSATDYNVRGQAESFTDSYGGKTTYAYDAAGRIAQTRAPDGVVSRTVYDALGRPEWTIPAYLPPESSTQIQRPRPSGGN